MRIRSWFISWMFASRQWLRISHMFKLWSLDKFEPCWKCDFLMHYISLYHARLMHIALCKCHDKYYTLFQLKTTSNFNLYYRWSVHNEFKFCLFCVDSNSVLHTPLKFDNGTKAAIDYISNEPIYCWYLKSHQTSF